MRLNGLKNGAMLAAVVFLSQMTLVARAQPDMNEMPKAENPAPRARPNRPANGMGISDEAIRKMMEMGGVPDVATQDAVLAYMKEDVEARRPLRDTGMKLFQALRAGDITNEQMLALVADYRAAQQAEKVRREQAQDALDAKVNFTQNPRLEAMLLLAGLVGDGGSLPGAGQGGFNMRNNQGGNNQGGNQGANAQQREEHRKKMLERLERFDKNANGQMDPEEIAAMRQWRQERREQRQQKNNPAAAPASLQGEMPAAPQDRAQAPEVEDDGLDEDLNA